MALNERLQILVTADGKGAVREFAKIGASAEKELGRTDDRIKKLSSGLVSNGTQIALAGGIATAGVFALARAAGDYEEAASAAGVIFGDAAEDIEKFGKEAINTAGLSRRAAVEAANTFGTFGKAAGLTGDELADFSTDLTQLAGDLASFKNTSTEDAITAIGAALRGESEPIRRYGVLLDDATLKQEALELGIYDGVGALDQQTKVLAAQAAIFKQTTDAQGDYQRTSESLSNQTRAFTAQIDNLKVGLGEGAVPVFSELVSVANDALLSFQNLNPQTQDLVGRIGAIGAIGVTAAGGLSVLAGGALRLVDSLGDIRARAAAAEGMMGRLSRAGVIAGGALGAAGAAFAVYQLAQAMKDAATDTVALETAINNLSTARSPEQVRRAIMDAAEETENWVADLGDFAKSQTGQYNDWAIEANGLRLEFDNLDAVLNKIKTTSDSGTLQKAIDEIGLAAEASDLSANQMESVNEVLGRYQDNVDSAGEASANSAGDIEKLGAAFDTGTGGIDRYRNGIDEAAEATADFSGSLDDTNKLVKLSADLFQLSADRAKSFLGSIENSSAVDDLLGASLDLRDSSVALLDGIGALAGVNVEEVASGFGKISDEAAEALRDVLALGDDAQASIAAALQFQGADAARAKADTIRDGLVGVLDSAGVADKQIQYLLETIGLTPEQVETAIVVSGTDEAIAKLTLLRDFYTNADGSSGIPDEINTQVGVAIAEGRFVDAANLISLWVQDQEDGSINDPLLIALGLGDTEPASGEVEAWKNGEEQKPPAEISIGANVDPATLELNNLRQAIPLFGNSVRVDADTTPALNKLQQLQQAIPIFGVGGSSRPGDTLPGLGGVGGRDGNIYTPFAMGGRISAGQFGWVNEPSLGGELFRPSTDGFVMNAADTDRLIRGVESLVSGGRGALEGATINVSTTADAMATAEEIILAARAERHLVGAP